LPKFQNAVPWIESLVLYLKTLELQSMVILTLQVTNGELPRCTLFGAIYMGILEKSLCR